MHKLYLPGFFIALLMGLCPQLQAQKQFTVTVAQQVRHDTLQVDYFIKRKDSTNFTMGASQFSATYTAANLNLSMAGIDLGHIGPWDETKNFSSYKPMDFQAAGSQTSLNILAKFSDPGAGPGVKLDTGRELIGRLHIPITHPEGYNTFLWTTFSNIIPYTNPDSNLTTLCEFVNPPDSLPLCYTPNVPTLSYKGSLNVCQNANPTLHSSYTGTNKWYRNDTLVSGISADSLVATTSGTYTAAAAYFSCTSAASNAIHLNVTSTATPILSRLGGKLYSSVADSIQWYFKGELMPGVTAAEYTPTASGKYQVKHHTRCGTQASNEYDFTVTGTGADLANTFALNIYPNPTHDITKITYFAPQRKQLQVNLLTGNGVQVGRIFDAQTDVGENTFSFNIRELGQPDGVYYVTVQYGDTGQVYKLIQVK